MIQHKQIIIHKVKEHMIFYEQQLPASQSSLKHPEESKQKMGLVIVKQEQIQKYRQWTQQQHVLYIIFLEMNRQKIKSRFLRRSNTFYKEMSGFVKTKSGVQCRSHNQKYQDKYKYPHKIIREEKLKIPNDVYQEAQVRVKQSIQKYQTQNNQKRETLELKEKNVMIKQKSQISCQTDIQGTEVAMVMQSELYSQQPNLLQVYNPPNLMLQHWKFNGINWYC